MNPDAMAADRQERRLRAAVSAAIFDPGATEGLKGERTLTGWQTDAVMRALAVPAPESSEPMDSYPTTPATGANVSDWQPASFVFARQGESIVTICHDGRIEIDPKYANDMDAVVRAFWEALRASFTNFAPPAPESRVNEATERAAFEAWAAAEWRNSGPPHSAWIGWQGRAGLHRGMAGPPTPAATWHLGSMNDGLFILDRAPSPAGSDVPPHAEYGPTMVLNVTELPADKAQAVVEAHNAALAELRDLQTGRIAVIAHTKEHAQHLYTVALACLRSYDIDPEADMRQAREMRDALKPFAHFVTQTTVHIACNDGRSLGNARDDALACGLNINVGDLRRAAALLGWVAPADSTENPPPAL